jgi:hypothetical protein
VNRPRGYAGWRPHRKTEALLEQVDEVLVEYENYLPLTVRQIFYRLVGQYGYPKDELAYGRLCEHLNRARRARMIPFASIRDDGVTLMGSRWYAGVEAFRDETGERIRNYQRDRQNGQPQRLELWCEAGGMMPQLERIASTYSVLVRSASGFTSVTGTHDIAARAIKRTVPTVILHVGDYDPSGVSIFESMTEDAAAFVEADRDRTLGDYERITLRGVRVALTAEQVEGYGLPTAPPKRSDSRAGGWVETCQAEALPPDELATIVEDAIASHIDRQLFYDELAREKLDRNELLGLPRGST